MSPLFLDRTACDWCYRCCLMYMVLPQIEEEIALKELGSAIFGTRRELTWISLYVLRREVGISIVYLVIRFRGSNVYPWVMGRTLRWDGFALRTFGLSLLQVYRAVVHIHKFMDTIAWGR
jgi:hypothetical protein